VPAWPGFVPASGRGPCPGRYGVSGHVGVAGARAMAQGIPFGCRPEWWYDGLWCGRSGRRPMGLQPVCPPPSDE
jgi:hypothetical protein